RSKGNLKSRQYSASIQKIADASIDRAVNGLWVPVALPLATPRQSVTVLSDQGQGEKSGGSEMAHALAPFFVKCSKSLPAPLRMLAASVGSMPVALAKR